MLTLDKALLHLLTSFSLSNSCEQVLAPFFLDVETEGQRQKVPYPRPSKGNTGRTKI